jgi:hypothetical protein
MTKRILTLGILFHFMGISAVSAQTDTTEYLFKKAKYSYVQYGFGYSPMYFSNGQVAHGFTGSLIGVVLNDKIAFGLDIDGFATSSYPTTVSQYPMITSFVFLSLNVEPLIRPRKVINFSFPVKIGYGGAQIYEFNAQGFGQVNNPEFMVVQPGFIFWANLFKPISLGVGGAYRMAINSKPGTFEKFSGFSGYVTLRFKFYTKEYMAKALERQKQYMQQQQPK